MKAKHSVWKSKLVKTTLLMTAVLVAALFLGTAASAGLKSQDTKTQDNNTIAARNEPTPMRADGLAPRTITKVNPNQHEPLLDRGYFFGYDANNLLVITFDTPDAIDTLASGVFPNFCGGADIDADGNWYGCDYAGGLYLIDTETGAQTFIASTIGVNGMAFDYLSGNWYVSSANSLYIMDITTGVTTLVGSHGITNTVIGLASDKDGNMYAYDVLWTGDSTLYSINTATGAATVIGDMGYGFVYAQDCAYDRDNDVLYIAGYFNDGSPSALLTCDVSTGAATIVGSFEGGIEVDGLAIPWTPIIYDHDMAVSGIVKPTTGSAGVITPEVNVKNKGRYTEYSVPVQCSISKKMYTTYLTEAFESTFPPAGWTVQTIMGGSWHRNDFWAIPRPNLAGAGYCADADVDKETNYPMLTALISPSMDLSTAAGAILDFDSYEYVYYNDYLHVDFSTDGGTTWTNEWKVEMTYKYGVYEHVAIDLSAYAGFSDVKIRFLYFAPSWDYYWQVDNVQVRSFVWSPEYVQTAYVSSILVNETVSVLFPDWTPTDLGLSENVNIEYQCEALSMLVGDEKVENDYKSKNFILSYGFFDDVAVTQILSPQDGLAEIQTPEVVVANHGQNNENVNVNMQIGKVGAPTTILTEDFSGGVIPAGWGTNHPSNWLISYSNYAGGVSPELEFYYYPSSVDDFRIYTAAIDTSSYPALILSFKEYVNDFNGDYLLKIQTSTDTISWTDVYVRDGGPYGPATTEVGLGGGSSTLYIAWTLSGNSYNINYWYIDDVELNGAPISVEYEDTQTVDIAAGETTNVVFDDWMPADIPFAMGIDYVAQATATINGFTQIGTYGFEDYVPPSGAWTMSSPAAWTQSFTTNAGGISPEARMSWSAAYDGCWFMSPAVDTTGLGTVTLSFANYIDDYGGYADYSCFVQTRSDASDSWTDRTPWTNPVPGNIGPGTYSIGISDDIGTGTQVRFLFNGVPFDIDYWYIDDVSFGGYATDFSGSFPPAGAPGYLPGWTEEIVVPDSYGQTWQWALVTAGTVPSCSPHSGTYMEMYDSWDVSSGSEARLKYDTPLDLASIGAANIVLKFWMYYYSSFGDYVDVQASLDGSSWTTIGHFANDGTHGTGWVQNTVDLSVYASESAVYLAFLGHSLYMYNPYIDDISLEVFSSIPDGNPGDNVAGKLFTLSYEHDAGVVAITEPSGSAPKRDEGWLQYDNGVYSNAFGSTTGQIYGANRFTNAEVGAYIGWKVDTIMFKHYGAESFSGTVRIYDTGSSTAPGAIITSEPFSVTGAGWFNITLTSPVTITGSDIWLGVEGTHATAQYPLECSTPGISLKSAFFSSDDITWYDLTGLGYNVAWEMRGHVTSGGGGGEEWLPGTYPVEGIIQNLGVTYSEVDIPVNAQITNDTGVVVYDETVIVAGPLAPGATAFATFPTITIPSEPSAEGDYKLTMKTVLPGDDHPNNDKKTLTWIIRIPDTTPPTTTATISGTMGQNNWFVSNVQVTLTATDGKWPAGVDYTMYKVDSGAWTEYTTPIVVSTDGQHTVYFYSVDLAIPPNTEATQQVSFKMDKTAPVFTNYSFTPLNFMKNKWLCSATVEDATSGVVLVEFYVDDALVGSATETPYEFEYNGKPTNNSQALAYDAAGNSALSAIAQYYEMGYQQQSQPTLKLNQQTKLI